MLQNTAELDIPLAGLTFVEPTPVDKLENPHPDEPTNPPEQPPSPWPRRPRQDEPDNTPTSTSTQSGGDLVKPKDAAIAIAGIVCVVAMGVSWLVMARTRGERALRQPSRQQSKDVAEPLARIAARHVDASLLHPDLGDTLMALSALGAYIGDGPLITKPASQPNDSVDPEDNQ